MNYVNLHGHSTFSLLDGLSQPEDITERCLKLGYNACALTDHGTISGAIEFSKECQDKNIKPILGTELYICDFDPDLKSKENKNKHHLVVLAKNLAGWKNLIKLTSKANKSFYYKPRLSLFSLREFAQDGNLISFSGHFGSTLANIMLDENGNILPDAKERAVKHIELHQDIFGKENFFVEIQRITAPATPITLTLSEILREAAVVTNARCVATADSHYAERSDAFDQKVLLCTSMKLKMKAAMKNSEFGFFRHDCFHIPSIDELKDLHTEEEINNTQLVADMCENYKVTTNKPLFPTFPCPNNLSEVEYLREVCKQGWVDKIKNEVPKERHQEYGDRVKNELAVLEEFGFCGYFLIVRDYIQAALKRGEIVGPGRGSIGGSLVAYLADITQVNPIPYNLIFERFLNAGRLSKDKLSFPDIDTDFQKSKREETTKYIRDTYGHDKVAQICTFHTMKGRSAIKDVFNAHEVCSYDEMNEITKYIPDEAKISDELQLMEEEEGESSIIRWALENHSKELSKWCELKDDGSLEGDYAQYFAQAMRLEGTKRGLGRHASGLVISSEPLADVCPMIHSEGDSEEPVTGFDMVGLEYIGLVKMDILGLSALDRIADCQKSIRSLFV